MKEFIKKYWKAMIIILLIIGAFLTYYEILPRHNQNIAEQVYNNTLNVLANNNLVALRLNQNNETKLITMDVCSEVFQQNYNQICGGQQ